MNSTLKILIITFSFFALYFNTIFAAPASNASGSETQNHKEAAEEAWEKGKQHAKTAAYSFVSSNYAKSEEAKYALKQAGNTHFNHSRHQDQIVKKHRDAQKKES